MCQLLFKIRKKMWKPLARTKRGVLHEFRAWTESYQARRTYCSGRDRRPFYDLAKAYLPPKKDEIIVDIGAGLGYFAEYLQLEKDFGNLHLLDGDDACIQHLQTKFRHVIPYKAPDPLPFEDKSVSFIHCSHLVEHLYYTELYAFLLEINRILKPQGMLIISTPLLWENFYNELSHVKPYHPGVFIRFLCQNAEQTTLRPIDDQYAVEKLIYRYTATSVEEWGAEHKWLDCLIHFSRWMLTLLKIKKYRKTGYTLVLQKG